MPSPTEITVPQLARLIGLPREPALVDVRDDEDFAADPRLIPGSVRRCRPGPGILGNDLQGEIRRRCLQQRGGTQPRRCRMAAPGGHICRDP